MRAQRLHSPAAIDTAPLRAEQLVEPEPGVGELRLRVHACGICRTDLHVIEGELPPRRTQVIPGHQVVGVVDKIGPGADRFPLGARLGVAWLRSTCGTCVYCQRGSENLCPVARFTGYDADGGYAEYCLVPEAFAYEIPEGLGDAEATPLLCAGIIGYRALRRAETRPGCRLGLYGFGSSAHLTIQVARHWGCEVFVMTRDARHRNLARDLGATWSGETTEAPPKKLDSAIVFAPAGEVVPAALDALDYGGTLAVAGIHLSDIPPLVYERHLFHEKTLRSVTANTRQDGEELFLLAARIPLRPRTTIFSLEEANRALRLLKHDAIPGSGVLDCR